MITAIMPLELTKVYTKHSWVFVPHYTKKGVFVGPDGHEYREAFLQTYCHIDHIFLWPRGNL